MVPGDHAVSIGTLGTILDWGTLLRDLSRECGSQNRVWPTGRFDKWDSRGDGDEHAPANTAKRFDVDLRSHPSTGGYEAEIVWNSSIAYPNTLGFTLPPTSSLSIEELRGEMCPRSPAWRPSNRKLKADPDIRSGFTVVSLCANEPYFSGYQSVGTSEVFLKLSCSDECQCQETVPCFPRS